MSACALRDFNVTLRSNCGDNECSGVTGQPGCALANGTRSSLNQDHAILYGARDINGVMRGNARDPQATALLERYRVVQRCSLLRGNNHVLCSRSSSVNPATLPVRPKAALRCRQMQSEIRSCAFQRVGGIDPAVAATLYLLQ